MHVPYTLILGFYLYKLFSEIAKNVQKTITPFIIQNNLIDEDSKIFKINSKLTTLSIGNGGIFLSLKSKIIDHIPYIKMVVPLWLGWFLKLYI